MRGCPTAAACRLRQRTYWPESLPKLQQQQLLLSQPVHQVMQDHGCCILPQQRAGLCVAHMRGCCCCDCYCRLLYCLQAEGLLVAQQLLHIQASPLPRPAAVELHGELPQQLTAAGLSSQLAGAAPAATTGQVSLPSSLSMRTGQPGNKTASIKLQGAGQPGK